MNRTVHTHSPDRTCHRHRADKRGGGRGRGVLHKRAMVTARSETRPQEGDRGEPSIPHTNTRNVTLLQQCHLRSWGNRPFRRAPHGNNLSRLYIWLRRVPVGHQQNSAPLPSSAIINGTLNVRLCRPENVMILDVLGLDGITSVLDLDLRIF